MKKCMMVNVLPSFLHPITGKSFQQQGAKPLPNYVTLLRYTSAGLKQRILGIFLFYFEYFISGYYFVTVVKSFI